MCSVSGLTCFDVFCFHSSFYIDDVVINVNEDYMYYIHVLYSLPVMTV